jgi:inorganic pyrophosphatase
MSEKIEVFIEVAKNSRTKYEYDEEKKMLVLDRILHSAVFYPHNYGFIPNTICGDGDPLDVLVMTSEPLIPGSICYAYPICHLIMEDEKGMDEKVLSVCANDPLYNHVDTKNDISSHVLDEISNFFETYKKLEKKKWVKINDWSDKESTLKLIQNTRDKFKEVK